MSKDSAVVAIVVALATGLYWGRFLRARSDLAGARAGLRSAVATARRAAMAMAAVGVVLYAVVNLWIRGARH